jgi:hypothetical protein
VSSQILRFEFYNFFENETSFEFMGLLEKKGKAYKIRKIVKSYAFLVQEEAVSL